MAEARCTMDDSTCKVWLMNAYHMSPCEDFSAHHLSDCPPRVLIFAALQTPVSVCGG